jgi:hypothetical protein
MYSACIFCHSQLGSNQLIEHYPVGQKLAFDTQRGRLWVICRSCGGWNLAPLEERWEPIEECERVFRGTRMRFSTANIGLASHRSGLELVRIGRPLRPEFAAWRYAPRLKRRRRQAILTGTAGSVAFIGVMIGVPAAMGLAGSGWILARGIAQAWKRLDGHRRVLRPTEGDFVIRRRHLKHIEWFPARDELPWHFEVPLVSSRADADAAPSGTARISLAGPEGMRLASVALNILNRRAGHDAELRDAVDWIELSGSPFTGAEPGADPAILEDRELRRKGLEQRQPIGLYSPMNYRETLADLLPYQRLAFELAANEDQERLFMTSHLWLLERHWREAEEIAAIADQLLVPEGVTRALDKLRRSIGRDA